MALSRIIYCGLIWTLSLVLFPNLWAQDDILVQARTLAKNKQRTQALALLESHLGQHPGDGDARLLYGLVLSWEGKYEEARQALQMVLDAYPRYTDAALALINVELWSGNPERADEIARRFLEVQPNRTDLMLAQARALEALKRPKDAMQVLNDAHRIDPENREAIDMRRALRLEDRAWRTSFNFNTIAFNDHSSPWREEALSLQRGTSAGSLIFRFSRGSRFGYHSNLAEADWYPHITPGTYAYLNFGYSPEGILYPRYRAGAEVFHNFSHGYEGSAGMRRLVFSSARINVYTASLGRYHSDWYSSVRTFVTPGDPSPSVSFQFLARRYFGDGERYLGFRYSRGSSPFEIRSVNEIGILNSSTYMSEVYWRTGDRVLISASGGVATEDRVERAGLLEYMLSMTVYYRF